MTAIPCTIIRGGTSKGVFVLEDHLPQDWSERSRLLAALMGSPDPRQIDGLGGADPLTSKVAIVSRSSRDGIDLEYESVEVGIADGKVNVGVMCGNLLTGVAAFAVAEGLIEPRAPFTTARIYCRSNQKVVVARVPWGDGSHGDASSDVDMVFENPGGSVTGKLLPVGKPLTPLMLGENEIALSVVDAGTLYAFLRAEDFGLTGTETPEMLDADAWFRSAVESAREEVAHRINRERFHGVPFMSPGLVKMAIVASAQDGADVVARVINRAKVHKAYAVSGAICLAAAAVIPGTLVNSIVRPRASPLSLRIAHPSGVLSLLLRWSEGDAGMPVLHAAEVTRSARIIMRGQACVPTTPPPAERAEPAAAVPGDAPGEAMAS